MRDDMDGAGPWELVRAYWQRIRAVWELLALDEEHVGAESKRNKSVLRSTMGAIDQCIDPSDNFVGVDDEQVSPESARFISQLVARLRLACDDLEARLTRAAPEPESRARPTLPAADPKLSQREWEVAHLLAEGCSSVNIAARFGVSTNTVRTQMRRLYRKLGVCNRADLVREVMRVSARVNAP
jgi:DNA-binding CsgD family transcriptional regulator